MSVYLLPSSGEFSEIVELAKKAQVEVVTPGSLRDFILSTEGKPLVIATLRDQDIQVLNRHSTTLVNELPTIVMGAPGPIYTGEWVTLASAFPAIDYSELKAKLSKSGHLATSPEDLEKRGKGLPPRLEDSTGGLRLGRGSRSERSESRQEDSEEDSVVDADDIGY